MSTDGHEVEIKFIVEDVAVLEAALRNIGFQRKSGFIHESNAIYDRQNGELRSRGELLRLRRYGTEWKLTFKGRTVDAMHKTRPEIETSVGDGIAVHRTIEALGYSVQFRYEKFRAEWSDGTGDVVIDLTPVGNFAEIEGTPEWIDATAQKLGIAPEKYITKSYAALFFEWRERTRNPARHMTFSQCGTALPSFSISK